MAFTPGTMAAISSRHGASGICHWTYGTADDLYAQFGMVGTANISYFSAAATSNINVKKGDLIFCYSSHSNMATTPTVLVTATADWKQITNDLHCATGVMQTAWGGN